jgi:hypothetical protein
MTIPTVRSAGTGYEGTANAATIDVAYPASITAGDTLLLVVGSDDNGVTASATGWTSLIEVDDTNTVTANVLYKKAAGTETGNLTVSLDQTRNSCARIFCIQDAVDPTVTAPDVSTGATGASANPAPDALSSLASADRIYFAVAAKDAPGAFTVYPYTDNQTSLEASVTRTNALGVCSKGVSSSTGDTPGTFTNADSDTWVALTVSIQGTAGGVTVTGSGTPAAQDASASGTGEVEKTGTGTPAAQSASVSGTGEREVTGTGTPASQAGAASGTGTVISDRTIELTAANNYELRDAGGNLVASLSNISYEWYESSTSTSGTPDQTGTFNTDASGEATITLTASGLSAGEYGTLVLFHPSDADIRGCYRIQVS